ncbi:hypothetical protein GCM10027447_37380 [Glycomyces halotolerans]
MAARPAGRPGGPLAGVLSTLAYPTAAPLGSAMARRIFRPPRRRHHKGPEDFGLTAETGEVPFRSGRGTLHTWLIEGEADRVVVVGHGIGLSKSASLAHAKFLSDAGYTVLLFDHRNHGLSSADPAGTDLADRFTEDIVTLVEHLRSKPEHREAKIAVYGFSFSCFPATYVLRECDVDAVVCDSGPVADLEDVFERFMDSGALPLPGFYRVAPSRKAAVGSFARKAIATLNAEWPPRPEGRYRTVPMLLMAGEDDPIVRPDGVAAVADPLPAAESHTFPGTGHLQGIKKHPEDYPNLVLDFLKRAWNS